MFQSLRKLLYSRYVCMYDCIFICVCVLVEAWRWFRECSRFSTLLIRQSLSVKARAHSSDWHQFALKLELQASCHVNPACPCVLRTQVHSSCLAAKPLCHVHSPFLIILDVPVNLANPSRIHSVTQYLLSVTHATMFLSSPLILDDLHCFDGCLRLHIWVSETECSRMKRQGLSAALPWPAGNRIGCTWAVLPEPSSENSHYSD